jgi:hypothetical protein
MHQVQTKTKPILKTKPAASGAHKTQHPPQTDKRFQSAQYDPKFRAPSIQVSKVKIDKRFADRLKEDKFQLVGHVDKYGRETKEKDQLGNMADYYYEEE